MKKIFLVVIISLVCSQAVFAKEYTFERSVNVQVLLQELKDVGINLQGEDQVGYLDANENEIKIITDEDIDYTELKKVIKAHIYTPPTQLELEKAEAEKKKREKVKQSARRKLKSLLSSNITTAEVSVGKEFTEEELDVIINK